MIRTVAQLRERLADFPDDALVLIGDAHIVASESDCPCAGEDQTIRAIEEGPAYAFLPHDWDQPARGQFQSVTAVIIKP